MRNIPTDLLRTFVTVLELGSHSRAAERLGRSQPTVSLQIKRLQHLLDTTLTPPCSKNPRASCA